MFLKLSSSVPPLHLEVEANPRRIPAGLYRIQ
jgi:hypothetical protein